MRIRRCEENETLKRKIFSFVHKLSYVLLVQIALERESTTVWELSFVAPANHGVFQHISI